MKKLAVLLALLIAALALVACGGGSSSTSEESSPAAGAVEEAEETGEEAGEEVEEKAEEAKKEAEGGAALEIEADPEGNLAFTSDTASSTAGKVTVDFTNESPVPHDVAFEDEGGETVGQTEVIAEGSDSTTVTLKPGEYKYFCTIPGHRQAGMEGTLTVK